MSDRKTFDDRHCTLCGEPLPLNKNGRVTGSTGYSVCKTCLETAALLHHARQTGAPKSQIDILPPREMMAQLDGRIIGQKEAKQALAVILWKQLLKARGERTIPRSPILLYGPTGCGKTALVREAAQLAGLPFLSFDATAFSETGYRGKDTVEIVHDLAKTFPEHPYLPYSLIYLDEVDKLAAQGSEQRAAYSRGTQHALLKLVEGMEVKTESGRTINTANLQFVFSGAFSGLEEIAKQRVCPAKTIGFDRDTAKEEKATTPAMEDFIEYGMAPELMGRITRRVALRALTREELRQVVMDSKLSVFQQYRGFFKARGIDLTAAPERVEAWLDKAMSMKAGVRGLQTAIEEAMEPMLLNLSEQQENSNMPLEVWVIG